MKRLIAIIMSLCVCLLASGSFIYAAELNTMSAVIDDDVIAFCEKANDLHQRLLDHWGGEYPDYYAGAYIENQKFYILVTCEPNVARERISQVNGADMCSIVRTEYPYNMLMAVYEDMNNRFQNAKPDETMKLFTGWCVDEINNCITVSICSDVNVDEQIKNYLGYEDGIIEIEYVEGPNTPCSNVVAGVKDWVWHGGYTSTISFCAKRRNSAGVWEKGFVIAGHSGQLNQNISINGTLVGVVSARQYGDNCDVAFVNMNNVNSGYTRSQLLSSNYCITSHGEVGVVGTTYESHGMSTGITSGTVSSRSTTARADDDEEGIIWLYDMIKMRISILKGDSGSPLVFPTGQNTRSVIGTLHGKTDNGYAIYTKYSNIEEQFNLELHYDSLD